jgi:hypothetical protein
MFGWFSRKPKTETQEQCVARLQHHFLLAKGSKGQRLAIAAAMSALEKDLVQQQRLRLASEEQAVFMMTYECFVMWAIKGGMDATLNREEVESTVLAIHHHFTKHAWYRPDAFEKIWDQTQVLMPIALSPTDTGIVYPVTEMFCSTVSR